jgi:hypothetical protein
VQDWLDFVMFEYLRMCVNSQQVLIFYVMAEPGAYFGWYCVHFLGGSAMPAILFFMREIWVS